MEKKSLNPKLEIIESISDASFLLLIVANEAICFLK